MCLTPKRHVCGICLKLKSLLKTHYKQVNNAAAKVVLDVNSYVRFKPELRVLCKYNCLICDKTFQRKKSLRIHLLAHTKSQESQRESSVQEIKQDPNPENLITNEAESRVDSNAVDASVEENETKEDISVDGPLRRSKRKPSLPTKRSSKRKQPKPAKKTKINKKKYKRKDSVCDYCDSRFQTKKELKSHIEAAHGDTTEEEEVDALADIMSDFDETSVNLEGLTIIKPETAKSENSDTEEIESTKKKAKKAKSQKPEDEHSPRRHKCEHCGFKTIYKQALNLHLKRKHNIDTPESEIPPPIIEYPTIGSEVETGEEATHACDLCAKKFKDKRYLQRHLKEIHKEFPPDGTLDYDAPKEKMDVHYLLSKRKAVRGRTKRLVSIMCEFCSKVFDVRHKYLAHKRQHTKEKPFPCEKCGRRFASRSNLGPHLRTHTGERPHKCDFCDRTFNSITSKKKHLLTHTREYNHSCHICGRQFLLKSHLTEHLKRHMGVKNHQCDQCPKAFVTSGSLKEHYRTHTGERPYICQVCGKAFARLCHLKSHTKTQHNEPKKGTFYSAIKAQDPNKPHKESQKAPQPINNTSETPPVRLDNPEDMKTVTTPSPKIEEQSTSDTHMRVPVRPHPQEQYNMNAMQGMMRGPAPVVTNSQDFNESGLLNLAQARVPPREQYDMYHAMRREGFLNDHQHLHDLGLLNQIQFLNPNSVNNFM